MITLYSGIPGSGKSYKMVHDLHAENKQRFIIHNIDGLNLDYLSPSDGFDFLKYCADQQMEVIDFFDKDYQIALTNEIRKKYNKNCLVIVDECHEWFDKNKKQLKMWLSYHRHLNQDIWLVAHRSTNLPSVYRSYIEIEYRAKSGSILAIPGYFLYNKILGGERIGYTFTKKKDDVFKMYKSMAEGFIKKRASLLLPIVVVLCVLGIAYFLWFPTKLKKISVASDVNTSSDQQKTSVNKIEDNYRFIGTLGNKIIIEEMQTKRLINLNEVSSELVVMKRSGSSVTVFNVKLNRLEEIKFFRPKKESIEKGFMNAK